MNDGLPSQVVYCALQDHQGYMWFGTDAGVSRFDGKHFENYTMKDGLTDNEVLNMFRDSRDRIWFYTLNGKICYFQKGKFMNASNDAMLANINAKYEFMSFLEDTNGNVWLGGYGSQLVQIQRNNHVLMHDFHSLDEGFRRSWIFPYQFNKDEVQFYTPGSILIYKDGQMRIKDSVNTLKPIRTRFQLFKFNEVRSYYFSVDGVYQIDRGTSKKLIDKSKVSNYNSIAGIFVDQRENIFLFTKTFQTIFFAKGANGYNEFSIQFDGIEVGNIFIDAERSKWFCTTGSGVFLEKPENSDANTRSVEHFRGTELIESVSIDPAGKIWFGSAPGLLNCLEKDILKTFVLPEVPKITKIRFDKASNIWIVTSTAFRFIERKDLLKDEVKYVTILVEYLPGLLSDAYGAKNLAIDKNDSIVASITSGLTKFSHTGSNKYLSYWDVDAVMKKRIYCMYFDIGNRLWFENFNKLYCLTEDDHLQSFEEYSKVFLCQISDIAGLVDSTLIISTYGNGVHFFRNGKIINHISTSDGLAGDLCRKVFVDSTTIYVATNQGFSFFNYQNNVISDIRTITMADGIVSNDVKDICARGENIYLATSAGLCIVKKSIAQTSSVPPPVYITSVFSRDSIMKDLTKLRFSYAADFSLNYIAITFEQPEKIVYQYNVSGNESDWIETNNSSIAFSSLSPGDYTFQLRAKKYNSDWSKITTLQFTVVPPMWEQWWFRSLIFMFLAGLTYLTLRFAAERRYKVQLGVLREKQVLADERSRIAADMHDDLGADLSNLLLMSRMSESNESFKPAEAKHSSRFENYVSELIGKVDEIIWALNPRNDTLKGTIEYIRDYVSKTSQLIGLELFVSIPEVLPVDPVSAKFRRSLFLVVKESLNNIHHHSSANKLTLTFDIAEGHLLVFFEDNGKGFDVNTTQTGADGLFNMKKRIEELGGKFFLNSEIGAGSSIRIDVAYI
ncbi:MAG: hypothetical protein IPG01_01090 [Chitinophagaceae bacterium]|nr:hypothetical protein [Chitinophagaceae bacterium]